MAKIAAATGGGYFELTSPGDLLGKFDRVIDELHHQYALGFVPQEARRQAARAGREGEISRATPSAARKRYLAPRG